MKRHDEGHEKTSMLSRRALVGTMAIGSGAAVAGSRYATAQTERGVPQSVVTSPPRDFGPNAPPNVYVFDPDIVIVDPLFTQYVQGNTPIKRLWTGALWSEGPAWSAQGRYVLWSDILRGACAEAEASPGHDKASNTLWRCQQSKRD